MKTKLEMAHEWYLKHLEVHESASVHGAWQYADAMQAAADKREKEEAAQRRKEIREILNDANTFVEREGQHFDDVANQKRTPKVSRFERSDAVKEVLSRAENMGLIKPKADKEWQPDWSQAPEWATHFFCERDEDDQLNGYFAEDKRGIGIDFDIRGFDGYGRVCSCKTFNYQGDWRNSLRKRPK